MGYGDDFPPVDAPGEMTDEDWMALAGLGDSFNGDTSPGGGDGLLHPSSTSLDWMGEPGGIDSLRDAPASYDIASNYYDDSPMPWEPGQDNVPFSARLDPSLSSVGTTGVGSERKTSESGVQGYSRMDPASQRYSDANPAGGHLDPETGQWVSGTQPEKPFWQKALSFLGLDGKPELDRNGRPIQRSPSSSLAGIAAGAADKSASGRLDEAKLALQRDQTEASRYATQQNAQLRAGEIEMMRKRLLNAQRSKALYMLNSPTATPAQKAAAQTTLDTLDQQLTSPLMVGKPALTPMPTRPWWETALATAGLVGTGANATNYTLAPKSQR